MPQLDIGTYPSQVFWLLLSFGALYLFVQRVLVPQFSRLAQQRDQQVEGNRRTADQILGEIDQLQRQMDAALQDARREAKEAFEQASLQIKDDRQKQLASVDRMIQKNLKEAQARIHEHKTEILAEMNLMIEQLADAYPVANVAPQKAKRRQADKATTAADFDA